MKYLFTLIILTQSLSTFAFDRVAASRLLQQRNVSLEQIENSGGQLFIGEMTGAGRVQPHKIEAIFIRNEAILKHEIESINQVGSGQIESFRARGMYHLNTDIKGLIIK